MMVSSMVVKSFSIKKMMITMKSSVKNIEMDLTVEASTMASMDDRTFACLMSEVYRQKVYKGYNDIGG